MAAEKLQYQSLDAVNNQGMQIIAVILLIPNKTYTSIFIISIENTTLMIPTLKFIFSFLLSTVIFLIFLNFMLTFQDCFYYNINNLILFMYGQKFYAIFSNVYNNFYYFIYSYLCFECYLLEVLFDIFYTYICGNEIEIIR